MLNLGWVHNHRLEHSLQMFSSTRCAAVHLLNQRKTKCRTSIATERSKKTNKPAISRPTAMSKNSNSYPVEHRNRGEQTHTRITAKEKGSRSTGATAHPMPAGGREDGVHDSNPPPQGLVPWAELGNHRLASIGMSDSRNRTQRSWARLHTETTRKGIGSRVHERRDGGGKR
jgi:hypothetical protein